jgi:uncharacterized protein YjbI with pentapeptide repeats
MEKCSENDLESLKKRHSELSNNINRILFTLLSFGFFCALTLNQPDEMVIKNGGKIKIPFVSMEVDFLTFLIIGPIALLGITAYLILFLQDKRKYDGLPCCETQAYIFNLDAKSAKLISSVMFFGFTPLILLMFYIKSRVNPSYGIYAGSLMVLTTLSMAVYFFYQHLQKKETASAIAIIVLCGLLILPITPLFNLNSQIPISVSGSDLAKMNLKPFQLAGAKAEKTNFNDSVFFDDDLTGIYAPHAQFKNANFAHAKLDRSDLGSADFEKAILSWSKMRGSRLTGTVMEKAQMIETDLTEAVLINANLENANLSHAIFKEAYLERVSFSEADLTGAIFEKARLVGADLGRAKNLTQEQLNMACGDKDTIVPAGLTIKECPRAER